MKSKVGLSSSQRDIYSTIHRAKVQEALQKREWEDHKSQRPRQLLHNSFYLNRKGRLSHKLPKVLCMKICKDFNRYVNIDGEKHHKALSPFEEIWTVSCWWGRARDKILSLRGQSLAHANKNDMNWPKRVVFIHIIYSVYIHTYNKNKCIRRGRSWMRDKMSGGHGRSWIGKRDYRKYVTASWLCMKSWNKIWNNCGLAHSKILWSP